MKQFLKLFFCFVPFSILIYSFFAFFWAEYSPKIISSNLKSKEIYTTPGSLYFRTKELKKYNDLDVLFLGSSHAYRGFDTRFYENYGLNVFNLGSSSQTQIQTNILVERYLDSLNPKIVIYEVYPGTFMNDGVESSVDLLINGENDMRSIEMAFNINSITTYNALKTLHLS